MTRLSISLERWIGRMQRHAALVLWLALAWSVAMAAIIATRLQVDTDNSHLLAADLPWRAAEGAMQSRFPMLDRSLVAVLDAPDPETAADAQRALLIGLRTRSDAFGEVFALDAEPYFRQNGLLFVAPEALQTLADQLTQAQPFLGALDHDLSLRGLFTLMGRVVASTEGDEAERLSLLRPVDSGISAALAGQSQPQSWQALMGQSLGGVDGRRRFIELAPRLDYARLFPAQAPMDAARMAIADLHRQPAFAAVRVRLTGTVAMEHEELQTAFGGAGLALGLALTMAAALLWLALRSLRLVAAAVLTLVVGLLTTAAFAALAIGHLNLISVAFGVLYVGLGLDYALYLCMQLRERVGQGLALPAALPRAAQDVAGYMLVCALTVSLGFFAFVPTAFRGIGELGIISGAGMFISLALALSLLPALIARWPPVAADIAWQPTLSGRLGTVLGWPYRNVRPIWFVTGLLIVLSAALLPHARFDADPLNLRDPHSEALSTLRDLQADPEIPTLTLSVLAKDEAAARAMQTRLSALPEARRALWLGSFVPDAQDAKLPVLEDLVFALGPALSTPAAADRVPIVDATADRAALADCREALRKALATRVADSDLHPTEQALLDHLQAVENALEQGDAKLLDRLRTVLLGHLPTLLADLKTALQAKAVTAADLPPALVRRWRSDDGQLRVEVWPREKLSDAAAAARFIAAVQRVAPEATGGPVAQQESARAVVRAFKLAFAGALLAITLVLLVLLRSLVDTLLVLVPLMLAGLFSVTGSVLLGIPFNFANVIALPLILGVGVDYGVYLVQRGRDVDAARGGLLHTGTARAVLFGALITMVNFGNLMFARHPGMVSMGALLTIGLAMTLVCALVLLPGLLAWRYGSAQR